MLPNSRSPRATPRSLARPQLVIDRSREPGRTSAAALGLARVRATDGTEATQRMDSGRRSRGRRRIHGQTRLRRAVRARWDRSHPASRDRWRVERRGCDPRRLGSAGVGPQRAPGGAYVVEGEHVRWQPALDVTRIALRDVRRTRSHALAPTPEPLIASGRSLGRACYRPRGDESHVPAAEPALPSACERASRLRCADAC